MPLPPALAARLAKRGIISKTRSGKNLISTQMKFHIFILNFDLILAEQEEVFAESYDDKDDTKSYNRRSDQRRSNSDKQEDKIKYTDFQNKRYGGTNGL